MRREPQFAQLGAGRRLCPRPLRGALRLGVGAHDRGTCGLCVRCLQLGLLNLQQPQIDVDWQFGQRPLPTQPIFQTRLLAGLRLGLLSRLPMDLSQT